MIKKIKNKKPYVNFHVNIVKSQYLEMEKLQKKIFNIHGLKIAKKDIIKIALNNLLKEIKSTEYLKKLLEKNNLI